MLLRVRCKFVPANDKNAPDILLDSNRCLIFDDLSNTELFDFVNEALVVVGQQLVCKGETIEKGAIADQVLRLCFEEIEDSPYDSLTSCCAEGKHLSILLGEVYFFEWEYMLV